MTTEVKLQLQERGRDHFQRNKSTNKTGVFFFLISGVLEDGLTPPPKRGALQM